MFSCMWRSMIMMVRDLSVRDLGKIHKTRQCFKRKISSYLRISSPLLKTQLSLELTPIGIKLSKVQSIRTLHRITMTSTDPYATLSGQFKRLQGPFHELTEKYAELREVYDGNKLSQLDREIRRVNELIETGQAAGTVTDKPGEKR